jgi:hypothetical protein
LRRTRKRGFYKSEKLGLEQSLGHRTAVDRDKWILGAIREIVDRASDKLFSGSRFARDEDRRLFAGECRDLFMKSADRIRASDDIRRAPDFSLSSSQRTILIDHRLSLERAFDDQLEFFVVERLSG